MATTARPRLTAAAGRRFAWTVAIGFAVAGALLHWRGHTRAAIVLVVVGSTFAVAGAVVPTRLSPVEHAWMAIGEAMSRVTAPIVFAALYYVVLTPIGLIRRTVGRSPLARARDSTTFWHRREPVAENEARRALEHQF